MEKTEKHDEDHEENSRERQSDMMEKRITYYRRQRNMPRNTVEEAEKHNGDNTETGQTNMTEKTEHEGGNSDGKFSEGD